MRPFLISLFLFFSQPVFAVTYYWQIQYDAARVYKSPKPLETFALFHNAIYPGWTYEVVKTEFLTPTRYRVTYKNRAPATTPPAWTNNGLTVDMYRFGDSCDPGFIYNSNTGICDKDCSTTSGDPAYHSSTTGVTRSLATDPWPPGPVTGSPTMCSGSCQYALAQSTTVQCGYLKNGDPLIQYCLFKYSGTGQSCQPGDPAQNNGSTAPVPPTDPNDPTDPANNCGPTHVWSGTTCVAILEPDPADPTDPGTGGTDPGTGGGGPGTGGGDPGTGGGDPGTGGGDPGTGGVDPGNDGPDEEGDPVKGEACDLDLICEGDALQCAILRQQKTDRCNWELNEKNIKQIADSFTGDKYELGESTTDIGLSFNSALSSPRFLPSGCPAPQRITIQGRSYSLTWAYVCDFASGLSYVIVALAGLFFVVYVGRGFGGD